MSKDPPIHLLTTDSFVTMTACGIQAWRVGGLSTKKHRLTTCGNCRRSWAFRGKPDNRKVHFLYRDEMATIFAACGVVLDVSRYTREPDEVTCERCAATKVWGGAL